VNICTTLKEVEEQYLRDCPETVDEYIHDANRVVLLSALHTVNCARGAGFITEQFKDKNPEFATITSILHLMGYHVALQKSTDI